MTQCDLRIQQSMLNDDALVVVGPRAPSLYHIGINVEEPVLWTKISLSHLVNSMALYVNDTTRI